MTRTLLYICKDIPTTCPAVAAASSGVADASAADAPDSALPDPARAVTPSGTPHCKNAGSPVHSARQTTRSNQVERTAAAHNLRSAELHAGLRAATIRQLTPPWTSPTPPPLQLHLLTPHLQVLHDLVLGLLLPELTLTALAVLLTLAPAAYDGAAAATAAGDSPVLGRCTDTVGSPVGSANDEPLVDSWHCNNVLVDSSARTAVHTL